MKFDRLFLFNSPLKKNQKISRTSISIFFLIIISSVLIFLDNRNFINASIIRSHVLNSTFSVVNFFSSFLPEFYKLDDYFVNKQDLIDENRTLRQESEKYGLWEFKARRLEIENKILKKELSLIKTKEEFITAKVSIDTKSLFTKSIIINAGENLNIQKGQAAVTAKGLIGSIVEVYENYSRILLITDINSKIPVRIGEENIKAILTGNNKEKLELIYTKDNLLINEEDTVYTSGDGGYFNPGMPIGLIKKENDKIYVIPTNDLEKIQFVQVFLNNYRNF